MDELPFANLFPMAEINERPDPYIHRLPDELASLIFQRCCPEGLPLSNSFNRDDGDWEAPAAIQDINPLILAAVCRYWRKLAFETPNLWNSISIRLAHERHTQYLPLAREWLDRSAMLPLYIDFEVDERFARSWPHSHSLTADVIDVLNDYAPRWRALDITVNAELLQAFRCHDKPSLTTLYVNALELHYQNEGTFDLGVATSPTKLYIHSIQFEGLKLDLSQLVHFACWDLPVPAFHQVLLSTPRLESFRVDNAVLDEDEDAPADYATCTTVPNLRTFNLSTHPRFIWDTLSMPSVRNLTISDSEENETGAPWSNFQSFLLRSRCVLTQVKIVGIDDVDYPDIFSTLCRLQELEQLELDTIILPKDFFQHMHDTASLDRPSNVSNGGRPNPFLPRLRRFEHRDVRYLRWSWVPLLCPPAPPNTTTRPLTEIVIARARIDLDDSFERYMDKATLSRIQDAGKRGITIRITTYDGRSDLIFQSQRFHSKQ